MLTPLSPCLAACLPDGLPDCLPACLPDGLPDGLPACLPACLTGTPKPPTLPTDRPTGPPTYLLSAIIGARNMIQRRYLAVPLRKADRSRLLRAFMKSREAKVKRVRP